VLAELVVGCRHYRPFYARPVTLNAGGSSQQD
jgi:hypothetical protein